LIGAGLLTGFSNSSASAEIAAACAPGIVNLGSEPWRLDPTGTQDCSEALERAARENPGALLYVPAGQYRIDRTVRFRSGPIEGRFTAGLRLVGAGMMQTTFISGVSNAPMFLLDYAADGAFQAGFGIDLSEFSARQPSGISDGSAIVLRSVFNARLSRLHVKGFGGDGIVIACRRGDEDGSNMVALNQVRIEDCGGWGLDATPIPGANEISYLHGVHLFVQGCGSPRRGGGIRWKGQSLALISSAITVNRNAGLHIAGGPGLPNSALLLNTTFENNGGVSWLITGCQSITGQNLQIYVNGSVTPQAATHGVLIDGTHATCSDIAIEGVAVRATEAASGFTSFALRGGNADRRSIRVDRVNWQSFDYADQRRFDGFWFDHVDLTCSLRIVDGTHIVLKPVGRGNVMPLRLRGPAGGGKIASVTGEWVPAFLPPQGVSSSLSGHRPGRYHVYFYDRNGALGLEVSTAAPVLDPVSGYRVRADSPAHLFVGTIVLRGDGTAPQIEAQSVADA
jgi:hypothetical protein